MLHGVKTGALLAGLVLLLAPGPGLAAQSPADRADPSVVQRELRDERPLPSNDLQTPIEQNEAAPAAASGETILVGAIRVEGATMLPPAAFAPAIEPWLGRPLGEADLSALATAVANVARRAGYGLASAWIPRQTIANGVLTVAIDEGRIDAIEAEGSGKASVEPILARLADGRPVKTAELERQLLLAGDRAGLSVGRARLEHRGGRNILHVEASRDRAGGRAYVDNWGSSSIGPVRARLDIDVNGLLARDDRLSLGGVVTPLQPSEFQFARLGYTLPLDDSGTEVTLAGYVGHSRPGAGVGGEGLEGTSLDAEATLSHPLLRSRAASLWANATLGLRDSSLDREGVRERKDRIATARIGVNGVARAGKGWVRGRLGLVRGVGALGATRQGDPLASRSDAGAVFTKVEFSAQYAAPLAGRLSLNLAMEGQLASRPLLASEEMGLGGRSFLRAYDYREVSGDTGAAASAELRFDVAPLPGLFRRTQLYAFGDAGTVDNLRGGSGGGSLASAGGGLRIFLKNGLEGNAELGVPIGHSPFHGNPDPRFSFALGYGF